MSGQDTPAGDGRAIASGLAEDATPAGAGGSTTPAGVRGGASPGLGPVIAIGSAVAIGGAFAVGVFSGITGIQSA